MGWVGTRVGDINNMIVSSKQHSVGVQENNMRDVERNNMAYVCGRDRHGIDALPTEKGDEYIRTAIQTRELHNEPGNAYADEPRDK